MNRTVLIILMCAPFAIAQSKLAAPLAGVVRDSAQHLRLVDGISGNLLLRDTISTSVAGWAFDGHSGLAITDSQLLTLAAGGAIAQRIPKPDADAVLGPQNVFFPETAELWQTGPKGATEVSVEPAMIGGSVIAVGSMTAQATPLAVCRANVLWLLTVDTTTGAITHESTPAGAIGEQACISAQPGTLVVLNDRLLLATGQEILIQTAAGVERHISIGASRVTRAGAQWVEVESAGAPSRMIRINGDGETLYQLPAAKELP